MATYTLAQARDKLSKLVDEAMAGGAVTITRHGKPVVSIVPAPPPPRQMTVGEIDAMFERANQRPLKSGTWSDIIRSMRDDEPE